jgi:N-formylglutamate amidohydrolase
LEIELNKLTDAFTDELFAVDLLKAPAVVFMVSRMVLDPKRFLDDGQEVMARRGMGVVYTRTSEGRTLRGPMAGEERDALIARYYRPHHLQFEKSVHACLKNVGSCTIVDCHSYPSQPLSSDLDQSVPRPDICIGTDAFHTPDWLTRGLCHEFEQLGYTTAVDAPYAGTIVPMTYYRCDPAVRSVMIEVNRKLYMDEQKGTKNSDFDLVKRRIAQVMVTIASMEAWNIRKE